MQNSSLDKSFNICEVEIASHTSCMSRMSWPRVQGITVEYIDLNHSVSTVAEEKDFKTARSDKVICQNSKELNWEFFKERILI